MHNVLVVDDDIQICRLISNTLKGEGFEVEAAHNLTSSLSAVERRRPDVAIVDLTLGAENGLDLVRELQKHSETGIIILSGKGDTLDRIIGLEVGADDYIVKPFDLRELLARIRSVLRRAERMGNTQNDAATQTPVISFLGWRLDQVGRILMSPDGSEVPLTTVEFDLLSVLAGSGGTPIDRDVLFRAATGHDNRSSYDRSVDVHIANLRKKIEQDPANPQIIKTVRGIGYVMAAVSETG